VTLTTRDERVLVGVSLAATRDRVERVARGLLDGDDAACRLVCAIAANKDDGASWRQACEVLRRRKGNALNLLDLAVEIGQQQRVRRGEPRTWEWPHSGRQVSPS
jgi:hypothetical protein